MGRARWKHDAYHYGPHLLSNGTGVTTEQSEVFGFGDSTTPVVPSPKRLAVSTVARNFMQFRASTAGWVSGTPRGIYLRLYIDEATDGEALRAFTTIRAAVTGGTHGAHLSLNKTAAGSISGSCAATRSTLHILSASEGGHQAAVQAEIWIDAVAAVPPAEHGIFSAGVGGGDAASKAKVKNLLLLPTNADITGNKAALEMICNADVTGNGAASAGGLQIRVNGVQMWLATYAIA